MTEINTLGKVIRLKTSGDIRTNALQEVTSINALQGVIEINTLGKVIRLKTSGDVIKVLKG